MRPLFLAHVAQTSDIPLSLEIAKGEGVYLYDVNGKRYMDLIAGIGVSALGHCHPKVTEAVQQQASQYMHTLVYGEYILAPQVQLAKLLADVLPPPLDCTYFVNSGTEATEGAMKLAKRYTGRSEIVSMHKSYHGSTQGALSLMSEPYFSRAFRPLLPDIRYIRFNEDEDLAMITHKTAAVFVETVRAEIGVEKPANDYLKKLRQRCTETGALLVLDEIQAGCGRTGTLFAFEQYGVVPDVLLLAKGFGGGMPIGAFVAPKHIMECLSHQPVLGHITTFGGHPVSCAASLATMRELSSNPSIIGSVFAKEELFRSLLVHPAIKAVKSAGLLMAVELEDFETTLGVIRRCLENGVVVDWFLFNDHSLRIAPPLIISEEEIRWACGVILSALPQAVPSELAPMTPKAKR